MKIAVSGLSTDRDRISLVKTPQMFETQQLLDFTFRPTGVRSSERESKHLQQIDLNFYLRNVIQKLLCSACADTCCWAGGRNAWPEQEEHSTKLIHAGGVMAVGGDGGGGGDALQT